MINLKRISIKPLQGIRLKNEAELKEKQKQIIEILGIKASELNCVFDEEPEDFTEAERWHHFTQPMYTL